MTTKKKSTKKKAAKSVKEEVLANTIAEEDGDVNPVDHGLAELEANAMTDEEIQASMTKRQKDAIQSARAKLKMNRVKLGKYDIPPDVKKDLPDNAEDLVSLDMPVGVKLNHVEYGPGKVIVPRHIAETIEPMVTKKQQNELSIFIGRNYRVQKIAGKMVREDLGSQGIDLKRLTQ